MENESVIDLVTVLGRLSSEYKIISKLVTTSFKSCNALFFLLLPKKVLAKRPNVMA